MTSGAGSYAEVIFLVGLKTEEQPLSHLTSVQPWPHHHIKKCQAYPTGLGWVSFAHPSTENLRAGKGRKWEYSKKGQWNRTVAPLAWLSEMKPSLQCVYVLQAPALPISVKKMDP